MWSELSHGALGRVVLHPLSRGDDKNKRLVIMNMVIYFIFCVLYFLILNEHLLNKNVLDISFVY